MTLVSWFLLQYLSTNALQQFNKCKSWETWIKKNYRLVNAMCHLSLKSRTHHIVVASIDSLNKERGQPLIAIPSSLIPVFIHRTWKEFKNQLMHLKLAYVHGFARRHVSLNRSSNRSENWTCVFSTWVLINTWSSCVTHPFKYKSLIDDSFGGFF